MSVVIPTYQRRDVVVATVSALARCDAPWPFEVVVVVDGSTDGTADALRALRLPFALNVVEQQNLGASAARNRGAAEATGEILLFLDDDMEPERGVLVAHAEAHVAADAVVGDIPLHDASPRTIISEGVGTWAERRRQRLLEGGALTVGDLLTGQLSIKRAQFVRLGGFDRSFTSGGSFGGEDIDFLHRLMEADLVVSFAPNAIARQRYVVTPEQYLRQWHDAGAATVTLIQKHPALADELLRDRRADHRLNRLVLRPLAERRRLARPVRTFLRRLALAVADRPSPGRRATTLFFRVRDLEFWAGFAAATERLATTGVRVLAYHAITTLEDPYLSEYCVTPEELDEHLAALTSAGCVFIDVDRFLSVVREEEPPPPNAVLLTFDDAYADLLSTALPILRRHGVTDAVVFAVSSLVGSINRWDHERGAAPIPLLGARELRILADEGVEVGSHSRDHVDLTTLDATALEQQLIGSRDDLEALGLPTPRLFAYPYGAFDPAALRAVDAAGYAAAFILGDRIAAPGADVRGIGRFEIRRGTTGAALCRRLRLATRGTARTWSRGWRPRHAPRR